MLLEHMHETALDDDSALEDAWPICTHTNVDGIRCSNRVNPKRVAALDGAVRCLDHPIPPKQYTVAPAYNKGAIQLITHGDIEDIGK